MSKLNRPRDRELLDHLEAQKTEPFEGTVWRTTFATRDPLIGNSTGGRWHPNGSFEALYTSLEQDGSLAEIYFHLSRAPVFPGKPMQIHELQVKTKQTIDLSNMTTLGELGVDISRYHSLSQSRTQEIGDAAYLLECDGLLVPSARWDCLNLILFLERLNLDEALSVKKTQDINWPGWKEQRAQNVTFGTP